MIEIKTSAIEAELNNKKYSATLIEFDIPGGIMEPSELKELAPPDIDGKKGAIISGRGPVWLFSHLTHHYHVAAWVATFDPRQGAVVTSVHSKNAPSVGSALQLPKAESPQ